ncbi:MAG: AAA family ATPase, partial [Magnetococcales bacterium]|nr:AAA family ATPase [Magnetococcales bacterium]
VASASGQGDQQLALHIADMTLQSSSKLLRQNWSSQPMATVPYDISLIQANVDPNRLTAALQRRPSGTFLFFGPPGTGKSALARHIAHAVGQPLMAKKTSDLISKWVGESERNIADLFHQAHQQQAVLLLDEADSFLTDRRQAAHSWEVTMVNEMLTQIESFTGIFIATTNLVDTLDQASLRRFSLKIRFDWLSPDQSWNLFQRELTRMGGNADHAPLWERRVRQLRQLTPGDFAVVARQADLWGESMTADTLYHALLQECQAKAVMIEKIGFTTC